MENTIDMQHLRYLNLFYKITKVSTSFCFNYNNMILFCVPKRFISQAIGKNLENLTRGSSHTSHYHQMMVNLHRSADDSESNVALSLSSFLPSARMRSMVLVFSDFYDNPEDIAGPLAHLRHLKCEIIFFHILDPMEIDFSYRDSLLLKNHTGGSY